MLEILFTLLHVVVGLVLIGVVLLQTGKRADLAGAFGGGGSQTAFGTRGAATFLSKMTTACAVAFMITSIALSILANRGAQPTSVLDRVGDDAAETSAPAGSGGDAGLPTLPPPDPDLGTDPDAADDSGTDPDPGDDPTGN